MQNITRRWFIGGAASFGAFAGCRMFEAHDFRLGGRPNVKVGVISDIHIRYVGEGKGYGGTSTLQHTFEWFRDQGADAVLIAGDMADLGLVEQLQAVADIWYTVFPNDRAPDGRKVEKLFVYGNHDWEGAGYGGLSKQLYPDEAERARHVLRNDYGHWWEKVFNEAYSPIYRKDINGYAFIGQHWDGDERGGVTDRFGRIRDFMAKESIDPALPFFYFQHPHPKDTCYGSWAWGHDRGMVSTTLSAYPNAVAFSGHSHYTLTDERSIWQGAFTSIGTSSLSYTGQPYDEYPSIGFENTESEGKDAQKFNAAKMMEKIDGLGSRQGMLMSVYDDCIVYRRRDLVNDLDLGDDWVMPLPTAESKPFAFAEHAKHFRAPEFPKGAKLTVTRTRAKNRSKVEKDAIRVVIPAPAVVREARSYRFDVTVTFADGKHTFKRVLARGFNHAPNLASVKDDTTCVFALDELKAGPLRVEVVPVSCFGKRGQPLVADFAV